ncbi:MAG: hypothetical protein K0A98_14245 [Trueperaceae bacterium]|nr:hypothetical protein [Trueperaceae bacterium]
MDKTTRPGGLYRNASGHGYHDAHGEAIPLAELPRELLTESDLAELDGAGIESEPKIPVDVTQEPEAPAEEPEDAPPAEEPKAPAKPRRRR